MYKVVRVSGIFGTLNKPTTRNTRNANDSVHAKRLARKKRFASKVSTLGNGLLVAGFEGKSGKHHCPLPCDKIEKLTLSLRKY